jgi:DNA primase
VFDARGLLHQEGRLKADIRVITLPEGMDPDDVTNQDPELWRELVDKAIPVVAHVMETLSSNQDLNDPKVKSEIASQVLPIIDDLPNPIERETYLQRLSRLLQISESTLLSFRPEPRRENPIRARRTVPQAPEPSARKTLPREGEVYEAHCVGILLREPELIYKVDRELSREGLQRFDKKDFQNTDYQILVTYIKESLHQGEEEPRDYIVKNLPEDFLAIVDELLKGTQNLNPKSDKVLEDLMRAFLSLRMWQIMKQNDHFRYLQETSHENGDYKAEEYQKNISHYLQEKHKIDKAMKRYTSRSAVLRT